MIYKDWHITEEHYIEEPHPQYNYLTFTAMKVYCIVIVVFISQSIGVLK